MIKLIHISSVLLSGTFFIVRGIGVMYAANFMQWKTVKIAPHVIDTVLLVSAIILCVQIGQYPFVDAWITVKVLALVAYIILGTLVIKRAKNNRQRLIAMAFAIFVFIFMLSVARSRDPLGFFSLL